MKKNKFDMAEITKVADALAQAEGTTVLKKKIIRTFAGTKGLDEYTIWRTFLLPKYRTDSKGVYDIAPLATASVVEGLTDVVEVDYRKIDGITSISATYGCPEVVRPTHVYHRRRVRKHGAAVG